MTELVFAANLKIIAVGSPQKTHFKHFPAQRRTSGPP
jgi:hypothetical protein